MFGEIHEGIVGGLAEEISEGIPRLIHWKFSEEITEESPWEMPSEITREIPERIPGEITDEILRGIWRNSLKNAWGSSCRNSSRNSRICRFRFGVLEALKKRLFLWRLWSPLKLENLYILQTENNKNVNKSKACAVSVSYRDQWAPVFRVQNFAVYLL